MNNDIDILQTGKSLISAQIDALNILQNRLDNTFVDVVKLIASCKGRLIIIGLGKSGIIGKKISATLNSTGTISSFIHASDALHGDLGNINVHDLVMLISKSGNTDELKSIIPVLKSMKLQIIGMTGALNSYLADQSDYILDISIKKEAGPNNLAPTTSTTTQLVMGDALSISLLKLKGFSKYDFAKLHPGGVLGRKLSLKVSDLYSSYSNPLVQVNDEIQKIIMEISSKRLGATAVLDNNNIVGVITDGDLRRVLESQLDIKKICAKDFMTNAPKTVEKTMLAYKALSIMKMHNITQLLVVSNKKYVGMIHLHDILKHDIF